MSLNDNKKRCFYFLNIKKIRCFFCLPLFHHFRQVNFEQNREKANNQYLEMSIIVMIIIENIFQYKNLTTTKCLFKISSSKRFVKSDKS